jgi:hypothetical protein
MDCQQFYFITPHLSDTSKHTKNKSWRRCRLYFRGRMQCWWIFDFETNYMSHPLVRQWKKSSPDETKQKPFYRQIHNLTD